MEKLLHYKLLAKLFTYPSEPLLPVLKQLESVANGLPSDAWMAFEGCIKLFADKPLYQLEEFYVETFLMNPVTSLDVGFVLFGQDLRRNQFLVNMQNEQQLAGNDCGIELADHLANVLNVLPFMQDEETRNELAKGLLMPAIADMHTRCANSSNNYQHPLALLLAVLKNDFEYVDLIPFEITVKQNLSW
jgi:nitrate reductase assembly molybdenum cofactor insertion protein NarJ